MIRIILLLHILFMSGIIFAEIQPAYDLKVVVERPEIALFKGLASFVIINPFNGTGAEGLEINITDENGAEIEIKTAFDKAEREIEIVFIPSQAVSYNVRIEKASSPKEYGRKMQTGVMLIDDFEPPGSVKSGHWRWVETPRLSGHYSFTGRTGKSFQRITLPSTLSAGNADSLIVNFYCTNENMPEEIIVEIGTTRRRQYFFSWGKDSINIEGRQKKFMGDIPETENWRTIEIPFSHIEEDRFQTLGFYYSGGNVWWDMISLNRIPYGAEIKNFSREGAEITAYFNYKADFPLKREGKEFSIIQLDASASNGADSFSWSVSGRSYNGPFVETLIDTQDRTVTLEVSCRNHKDSITHSVPVSAKRAEEIQVNFKVLPYNPFIKPQDRFNPVFAVTNLNSSELELTLCGGLSRKTIYAKPGKPVHVEMDYKFTEKENLKASLYAGPVKIDEKVFHISEAGKDKVKVDGPFMKNEKGELTLIMFSSEAPEGKKVNTDSWKVIIAGDYPKDTEKAVKESLKEIGINSSVKGFSFSEYGNGYMFFDEYSFAVNVISEEKGDIFIFFPFVKSMMHKTPLNLWTKGLEAMIAAAEMNFAEIVLATPFPAPPFQERYLPYRNSLKMTASLKGLNILDSYSMFRENSDRYFMHSEGIYRNMPFTEGIDVFIRELTGILNAIYVKTH